MVGRADELAALLGALRDGGPRLHTVTGTGGIGKSRLAAEVCASYNDASASVTWVSLAALRQPELVLAAVASAVGLPDDASRAALVTTLDDGSALLVLDTFEPVLAAANDVAALLDRTSGLRVLVTSRAPLRVRGERELPLRPLSEPAAAELFRQRANAARPGLVLDDGDAATSIDDIVRRLSCLPLALELAAAKVRHMSLPAVRDQLSRPLQALGDGERDLPERQRTMRAAIGWSYDLLPSAERQVFRRLAAFVDAWTLDVAGRVCAGPDIPADAMLSTLGRLCEHGLVQADETSPVARWRLLDPIRDYAAEQLDAAGESADVARWHAHAFAELVERMAPRLLGADQAVAREELRAAAGEVRQALAWAVEVGDADVALRLTGAVWMFWRMEGAFEQGRRWLKRALELPGADTSAHRSGALWGAAWLAYQQGDLGAATAYGNELLDRATAFDAATDHRNALTILGHVAMAERRFDAAVPLLEEALDIARTTHARWHVATSLLNLGTALLHHGDPVRAQQLLEEAVAEHEAVGDRHFTARSMIELGYAALVRDDPTQARGCFADALHTFVELRERWGVADAVSGFAVLAAVRGDAETTALLTGASQATYAEIATQVIAPDAILAAPFLAHARTTLGESRWVAAISEGRLLSIEQAAEMAFDRVRSAGEQPDC
jgi:predicted ATPase